MGCQSVSHLLAGEGEKSELSSNRIKIAQATFFFWHFSMSILEFPTLLACLLACCLLMIIMLLLLLLGRNPPIRNRRAHTVDGCADCSVCTFCSVRSGGVGMIDRDRRLETICKQDRLQGGFGGGGWLSAA